MKKAFRIMGGLAIAALMYGLAALLIYMMTSCGSSGWAMQMIY